MSAFKFTCECGRLITVREREGRCLDCGQVFRIVWPADGEKPGTVKYEPQKPVTISEKYDGQF